MRLKDVVDIINEKTDDVDRPYVALENIVSWDAKFVASNAATEGTNACFKSGDVLFGKLRPYLAKGYLPDYDGICSTEFLVMRPHYDMNGRYLLYWMLSPDFIGVIKNRVAGVKMPRTDWATVSQMELTPPPLELQQKIVGYLDEKTAAIDARVVVLEKKLAAYKRLKTSVINRAVTRGLDPKAKLKDSGVDWIGKVPAGWEVKRIKDVAKPLQYGASEVGLEYDPDLPRYIRITDITQDGELKDDGAQSLSEEIARPYLLIDGDILLARSGATVGKAFVYREKYGRAAFAGYMIRCRVDPSCGEFRFVYYWMLSSFYQAWKQRAISQATIQNIGADKYANLVLPLPNIAEQRAIADYLDAECAKIDKMAALVTREIELNKKLKRSLINEVVTGKRPVFADEPLPSSPAGSAETSRRGKEVA